MSITSELISSNSNEYGQLELLLQLNLKAPQFKITECYDISLKSLKIQFENFVSSLNNPNIVHVFIPLNKIEQNLEDILLNGIKIDSKTGFLFKTNSLILENDQDNYECIYLLISLGSVLNFEIPSKNFTEFNFSKSSINSSYLINGYKFLCISKFN